MFSRYFYSLGLVVSLALLRDNCADGALTKAQMETAANGMRNVCAPKVGVDPALVDDGRVGVFAEDEKFRCYIRCTMSLMNMLKNEKPALDIIVKQIKVLVPADSQDRSIAAARKCAVLEFGNDECMTAWQYMKCVYEADPEIFFMV